MESWSSSKSEFGFGIRKPEERNKEGEKFRRYEGGIRIDSVADFGFQSSRRSKKLPI